MLDLISLAYLSVLGLIGWIIYKTYVWPYYLSPLKDIPGLQSNNPLFGNFKTIFLERGGEDHIEYVKKYGPVFRFHEKLNRPAIVVADSKSIHEISLTNVYDYKRARFGDFIKIFGNGLVTAEGENHKRQRKMMNPAFTHSTIKEMVPSFTRVALTFKDLIEKKINVGESRINLSPYISKATLDVIGLIGFDYEFNSLTTKNELAEAYSYIMKPSAFRLGLSILAGLMPSIRNIPIQENKNFNFAVEVINRVSKKLVDDKYKNLKSDGKDLLSILININKTLPVEEKISDDELKYQVMTFLLAGHETTNVLLCWALYRLATLPHEQDLLREELVKAFPDKSKFNPTFDEINALEYLNCITKETLRLDSPVPATARVTSKEKVFGGYVIPKDTLIVLSIAALHRSPEIWGPTAEEFDPKRWLNPKDEFKSNFLPFSTGAKSCIGNKVALSEFKVILSALIRNFVFKPVEGLNIRKLVGARPDPYLELNISKVEA